MATSMSLDTTTFSLNGETWTIIQVPSIGDEISTIGETEYHTRTIRLLDWVDRSTKIRTLKHELAHVWMWEYGHNQHEREFKAEDVCEIIACSNDFINEIVEKYFKGGN
jgi:hypothetical protein|nr:MAG TPA: SprT-like domain-containing protein Spartan/DNA Complex repair, protease, DNA BINDING [Caudoviricetes sp.]